MLQRREVVHGAFFVLALSVQVVAWGGGGGGGLLLCGSWEVGGWTDRWVDRCAV